MLGFIGVLGRSEAFVPRVGVIRAGLSRALALFYVIDRLIPDSDLRQSTSDAGSIFVEIQFGVQKVVAVNLKIYNESSKAAA